MDDTLFDWSGEIVRGLNELKSPTEELITVESFRSIKEIPHIEARIELIKSRPKFYRNLPINPDALSVWEAARSIGYDCQILTKGPYYASQGWTEKYDCIREHLGPTINVHIVMDKSLVYGAVLYDDYPNYLIPWLKRRPRGLGIIPDQPINREFSHPQVIRHKDNLQEIYTALEKEFKRRVEEKS